MKTEDLIIGLRQACEHAEGVENGTRTRVVSVPDQIDVKAIREKLGISQSEFAIRFGFSISSLRNWEQGRRFPDGPARTLLKVIDADPEAVTSALAV
jgi:putative transcriptional regulator